MEVLQPGQEPSIKCSCKHCKARLKVLESDVFYEQIERIEDFSTFYYFICLDCGTENSVEYETISHFNVMQRRRDTLKSKKEKMKVNVATDIAVTINRTKIILIKRRYEPFKHKLCLPGGFFEPKIDQNLIESCAREAREEINLLIEPSRLKLFNVLSDKGRDPRPWGPRVSIVYRVDISEEEATHLCAGDDAEKLAIRKLSEISPEEIGFDHWKAIKKLCEEKLDLG